MGAEAECVVRLGREKSAGKALLESEELRFSGDFRLKIPFREIQSLSTSNGRLELRFADQQVVFELGGLAERWAERIRNPKTQLQKVGVRAGDRVALTGAFDESFLVLKFVLPKRRSAGKINRAKTAL